MNIIYITEVDHKKLIDILNKKSHLDDHDEALMIELNRATIVKPEDIPDNVITMNSQIVFYDIENKEKLKYWLVFPEDADISQNKISVLSPIGCALLGYKVGDIISVKTPKWEKELRVEKILNQPESLGNYE
ncbi:MAG: nucleoside diphosphate kinase regulator [Patescibacteria group bacterium]|nr:nucleoside diphosphate kinase regulator [Patescibacteria group bacterium]